MSECEKWVWQQSGYDDRVHAFVRQDRPAGFAEAACLHSVPFTKLARSHGPRCVSCLLIVGEHLAEHHHARVGC